MKKLTYATFLISILALIIDFVIVVLISLFLSKLSYMLIGLKLKKIIAFFVYVFYFVVVSYRLQSTPALLIFGYKYYTNKLKKPNINKFIIRAFMLFILIDFSIGLMLLVGYFSVMLLFFGSKTVGVLVVIAAVILFILPFYITSKAIGRNFMLYDYIAKLVPISYRNLDKKTTSLRKSDSLENSLEKRAFSLKGALVVLIISIALFFVVKLTLIDKDNKDISHKKITTTNISKVSTLNKYDKQRAKKVLKAIDAKLKTDTKDINSLVDNNLYKDLDEILKEQGITKYEVNKLFTPLQRVLLDKNNMESIKTLLEYGANIYNGNLDIWLNAVYLSRKKEILELYLDYGFDINYSYFNRGYTMLHYLAENKCKKMNLIEALLSYGANSEIKNKHGKKALEIAKAKCSSKDYKKFKELIKKYKNRDKNQTYQKLFRLTLKPIKVDDNRLNSLISMLQKESELFIETNSTINIYEHGLKIELLTIYITKRLKELNRDNPYKQANTIKLATLNKVANSVSKVKKAKFNLARVYELASIKQINRVKLKVYNYVKYDSSIDSGYREFILNMLSLSKGKIYKKLKEQYIKVDKKQKSYYRVLLDYIDDWYIILYNLQIKSYVETSRKKSLNEKLQKLYNIRAKRYHPIFSAIMLYRDKEFIKELNRLKKLEIKDRNNYTPLYLAVLKDYSFAIDKLLQKGAKVNTLVGATYQYSLIASLMQGYIGLVNVENTKTLIDHGLNLNLTGKNKKTAISLIAKGCQNFIMAKLLIENGANPYLKDIKGHNAFWYAKNYCKNQWQKERMLKLLKSFKGKK